MQIIREVDYIVKRAFLCGRARDRTLDLVLIRNALYH